MVGEVVSRIEMKKQKAKIKKALRLINLQTRLLPLEGHLAHVFEHR